MLTTSRSFHKFVKSSQQSLIRLNYVRSLTTTTHTTGTSSAGINKDIDITIYGASGFTGRLVAEYMNNQYGINGMI